MKTGKILCFLSLLVAVVLGDDDKSQTLHKKMIARRREVSKAPILGRR